MVLIVGSATIRPACADVEQPIDPLDEFAHLLAIPPPEPRWEGYLSVDNSGPDERRDREQLYLSRLLGDFRQGQLSILLETDHFQDYLAGQVVLDWALPAPDWRWEVRVSSSRSAFELAGEQTTFSDKQTQWQASLINQHGGQRGGWEGQLLVRQVRTDTDQQGLNGTLNSQRHTLPGISVYGWYAADWGDLTHLSTLLYHWASLSTVEDLTGRGETRLDLPEQFWQYRQHSVLTIMQDGLPAWRWEAGAQTSFGTRLLPVFQNSLDGLYGVRGYPDGVNAGDDLFWLRSEWYPWHTRLASGVVNTFVHVDAGWLQSHPARISTNQPAIQALVESYLPAYDTTLASVGMGLDAQWRSLHVLVGVARALQDDLYTTQKGDWRAHGMLRWQF